MENLIFNDVFKFTKRTTDRGPESYMYPFLDPRMVVYLQMVVYPHHHPCAVHVLRLRANARREKCVQERIHKPLSNIIHVVLCSLRELFLIPQFFAQLHEV